MTVSVMGVQVSNEVEERCRCETVRDGQTGTVTGTEAFQAWAEVWKEQKSATPRCSEISGCSEANENERSW